MSDKQNTEACKLILDLLNTMMLHNSQARIRRSNGSHVVEGRWSDLAEAAPTLRLKVTGMRPLNWAGPMPGALPNTNAAPPQESYPGDICPDCGCLMVSQSGCLKCLSCGYDKCG